MSFPLRAMISGWILLGICFSWSSAGLATDPTPGAAAAALAPTPTGQPELVRQGQGFFADSCPQCHNDDAHGGEGPDLHHLPISDAAITAKIKNGIGDEMPSFAKKYNDAQIAALVAYLRSLN